MKARNMVISVEDPVMGNVKLVGNPINLSENKPILNIPSPTLGQHTESILKTLGYCDEQILDYKSRGII